MLMEFRVLFVPPRRAPQLLGFTDAHRSGDVSGISPSQSQAYEEYNR
jgi:hypothetical protein